MISLLCVLVTGQYCATPRPAVGYQATAYQAPAYQNYDVVTKFVAVTPYADHAVLAGDYFRAEKQIAERVAAEQRTRDQISQLTGAVNQLREIVTVTTQTTTRQVTTDQPPPPPQYAAPPIPQNAPPLPSKGLPSPQRIEPVPLPTIPSSPALAPRNGPSIVSTTLAARCAGCHTGPSARGGVTIFTEPGRLAALGPEELSTIDAVVLSGKMPKDGPLTLPEYGELKTWLLTRSAALPQSNLLADRNPF
jgi:mono/diheme cytochrome c family protein